MALLGGRFRKQTLQPFESRASANSATSALIPELLHPSDRGHAHAHVLLLSAVESLIRNPKFSHQLLPRRPRRRLTKRVRDLLFRVTRPPETGPEGMLGFWTLEGGRDGEEATYVGADYPEAT